MSARARLLALLDEFARAVGLPALALDEGGVCTLAFDALIVNIAVRECRDELVLFAGLGALAPSDHAACEAALQANHFADDVVLALDVRAGLLVAVSRAPLEAMQLHEFQRVLARFLEVVEQWRNRPAGGRAEESAGLDGPMLPDFA